MTRQLRKGAVLGIGTFSPVRMALHGRIDVCRASIFPSDPRVWTTASRSASWSCWRCNAVVATNRTVSASSPSKIDPSAVEESAESTMQAMTIQLSTASRDPRSVCHTNSNLSVPTLKPTFQDCSIHPSWRFVTNASAMSLSKRGYEAAKPSGFMFMWEVLNNLYHPKTNPTGYVSLGLAENALMHDTLSEHIHENIALPNHALTYGDGPAGSKRLKSVMAKFLTNYLKPFMPIEPNHIVVANGCGSVVEHLSWALAGPGDGILLGQPYYGTFIPDISHRPGVNVVPVPFQGVDPLGPDAAKKYEDTLLEFQQKGQKIAALMLCHPHNPLGRCYSRSVLIDLMRLCEKYKIHLISDEIYALSVWTNTIDKDPAPVAFESALSIDPKGIIDPSRVHVVWGISKDFGANGLRLGALVSQNNAPLHAALMSVALYSYCSSLSEHVTANFLEDEGWADNYISENRRKLGQHFEIVASWAKQNGVAYMPGVNAAFFLWVNLGKAYRERHPRRRIDDLDDHVMQALVRKKVFLASGVQFGSEQPGWFRIVFSNPEDLLREGLRRVILAIDEDDSVPSKL